MENIFNVSDEEAKRIRLLHENESQNKKIDSSLITEQAQCGGQGQTPGKAVHWTGCPNTPNLLNPFPCAMVDNTTPHSGMIGWKVNIGGGHMGFCATITSISNFGGNLTSTTPTPLERSNSCEDCTSPYNPGGSDTYDCDGQGNCTQVQGAGGQYASQTQCLQNCQPPDRWRCTSNYQCVQDPNGPYATQNDCQQNCVEPDYTYDCNMAMGQCYQVAGGGGQYADLTTCQQHCEYDGKWTCKKYNTHHDDRHEPDLPMELGESNHFIGMPSTGWHCVKDPNGIHNTKAACEDQCPPVAEKIDCIDCEGGVMMQVTAPDECPQGFAPVTDLTHGPCVQCDNNICTPCGWCYGTNPMTFNSMAECNNSQQCSGGGGGYTCVGTGPNAQCQPDPNSTQTLQQCQQNCPPQTNLWECDLNNGCSQTASGTHQSQAACETACCQDVIANWNWAQGAMNNPCQKFHNEFYNNPPQTFADQCKYDWLYNIVLNLPGANPCVQGNFINLLDGFINGNNGCYGNPGSGCDTSPGAPFTGPYSNCPAQNSVCGKRNQFCGIANQSPSQYFKCQYAINFANANTCIC